MSKKREKSYTVYDWRRDYKKASHERRIDMIYKAINNLRERDRFFREKMKGTREEAIDMYVESRESLGKYTTVERVLLAGLHSSDPFYWHTKDKTKIITVSIEDHKLKLKRLESVEGGEKMWKDVSFKWINEKIKWSHSTSNKWNTKILEMQAKLHAKGIKGEALEKINEAQDFYHTYDKIGSDLESVINYINEYIDADMYIGGSEGQYVGDELFSLDVINTFFDLLKKAEGKIDYLRDILKDSVFSKSLDSLHQGLSHLKMKAKSFQAEQRDLNRRDKNMHLDSETPIKMQEWKDELRSIISNHGDSVDKVLRKVKYIYEKAVNS